MKKTLLITLLLIVGCSKEPINYETSLVERDGVFYTNDTNKSYSGQVFSLYDDGKKKEEGTFKDGKEDGLWTAWYENGQKKAEGTFKDGKEDGLVTLWYENGHKQQEGTFKDGEYDGLWTYWYENGQKKQEVTFKDGVLIDIDFALLLDKKIHCTDDSIMVSKIDIESEKYLIPYDEPYSTQLWLKVVDNLFVAGASHIIFNSNIPNITESYMDIEKNYNNVYRTMNKNELNNFQFDCPVKIKEYLSWDISLAIPVFGLSNIIDTDDITLRDPFEDIDWMDQFLSGQIPEWITEIEDEVERKEMMEALGVGDYFDITQSPFYNNVILIGF
ncbi:MAG: toxin-antitoxin system YwqK family antitoxin [Candidatus Marinimicrobia bacterium]|nr:toxin-antitoxin system YwqK family antitoxin [Candidatus Neomarinimicrobiota bacterium]